MPPFGPEDDSETTLRRVLVTTAGGDTAKLVHFEAVTVDQREGRLAGFTETAPTIIGRPLRTVEDFLTENRALFVWYGSLRPDRFAHT